MRGIMQFFAALIQKSQEPLCGDISYPPGSSADEDMER